MLSLKNLKPWLQLFFAVALFAFVLHRYDLEKKYVLALALSPLFWLFTLALSFIIQLLTTWRWQLFLARFANREVPFRPLFWNSMWSQFVGLAFLGTFGADLARGYFVRTHFDVPVAETTKSIFLDRIAGTLSLAFLCIAALPFYFQMELIPAASVAAVALLASCARLELFLGLMAHLLKLAMVAAILYLGDPNATDLAALLPHLTIGLGIEHIPISWQGFGLGHLAFATFLQARGADLYNAYFLSKTVFKLLGAFCIRFGSTDLNFRESAE